VLLDTEHSPNELPLVQAQLDGKDIRKTIVVPRKLVNLVV